MPFSLAISTFRTPLRRNYWLMSFGLVFFMVWLNSLVGTTDMSNWLLENLLVFLFLGFLVLTYRKYQFSDLSLLLICIYLCLHVYGSKYTYAENPFGYWKISYNGPGIIMTAWFILVLVSFWPIPCGRCSSNG